MYIYDIWISCGMDDHTTLTMLWPWHIWNTLSIPFVINLCNCKSDRNGPLNGNIFHHIPSYSIKFHHISSCSIIFHQNHIPTKWHVHTYSIIFQRNGGFSHCHVLFLVSHKNWCQPSVGTQVPGQTRVFWVKSFVALKKMNDDGWVNDI